MKNVWVDIILDYYRKDNDYRKLDKLIMLKYDFDWLVFPKYRDNDCENNDIDCIIPLDSKEFIDRYNVKYGISRDEVSFIHNDTYIRFKLREFVVDNYTNEELQKFILEEIV